MAKTALITGVSGQDGAYLAELLLGRGYRVVGACRDPKLVPRGLDALDIAGEVERVSLDLHSEAALRVLLELIEPDEIYNLAAQSSVGRSFAEPVDTGESSALGVARLIEAIRAVNPAIRLYQASSSEMFGTIAGRDSITEEHPFRPRSPYAAAKVYAHCMTINAREAYGLHASCGILFNHESPLRGDQFVTSKITCGVARIKARLDTELRLGNLDTWRDWGYAKEYVEAMYLMLQQDTADDYVIASGEAHSVREFVVAAFTAAELDWRDYVVIDPELYRPADVDFVVGDASKAARQLGWKPETDFTGLVELLVEARVGAAKAVGYPSTAADTQRNHPLT